MSMTLAQETPAWKKRIEEAKKTATEKMTQKQKDNFARLTKDLETIKGKSEVTPEQKQKLVKDLVKCLSGAKKPEKAKVEKLLTDLLKICSDKKIEPAEIISITKDIQAVLVSAKISEEDATALITDVKTILEASNVTKEDVDMIIADIKAIIETAKEKASKRERKILKPKES